MIRLNDEFIPPDSEVELDLSKAPVPVLMKFLHHGRPTEQRQALVELVARAAEDELVESLASSDSEVAHLATAGLWECWLNEEGREARADIEQGITLMNNGQFDASLRIFTDLGRTYPGWAEPINKQATVLYMRGDSEESYDLCELVIEMKPHHFGAWHGLALCSVRLRDWETALAAAKEALRLQPHAAANREIMILAKSKLRSA